MGGAAIWSDFLIKDSGERQLRAYVGPVFDSFRLTDKISECNRRPPAPNEELLPEIRICYWFENYGLTPAKIPHTCLRIIDARTLVSGLTEGGTAETGGWRGFGQ